MTQLYTACLIPGILLTLMHIIYISVRSFLQPQIAPATKVRFTWREKIESLNAVIIPIIIIMLVLGTMYLGVCTPTEAAGSWDIGRYDFLCYSSQTYLGKCQEKPPEAHL